MDGELLRLRAVMSARDRLRREAFRGGQENLPKEIAFSRDWLFEFQSLKDAELVCPTPPHSSSFWGVRLRIDDSQGPRALVTYANGNADTVQLEPQ